MCGESRHLLVRGRAIASDAAQQPSGTGRSGRSKGRHERPADLAHISRRVPDHERAADWHGVHDLFRAQGAGRHAGPHGSDPHRSEGPAAADRRRHQAARQGRPDSARRGQVGLLLRAAGRLRDRDRSASRSFRLAARSRVFGRDVNLYVTDLNVGALFVLAFSCDRCLRHHSRRLGVGEPLLAAGWSARGGAGRLLRNHPRTVAGRHLHAGRIAEPARHHGRAAARTSSIGPLDDQELVHPSASRSPS